MDVLAEFKAHLDICRSANLHAEIVACAGVRACEAINEAGFKLCKSTMPNSRIFFRLYDVTFMQDGTTPDDEIHFREAHTGKLLGSFTVLEWPDELPG